MMSIQYIIVAAVVLAALGYAAWRAYFAIRHANDKCYGCQLKEICKVNGARAQRQSTRGRGQCDSPCDVHGPSGSNGTVRRDTPLPGHRRRR